MSTLIGRLWHELVLRHGAAWIEILPNKSRRTGSLIECPCGKRWLSRAPWDVAS
ncbi:hypothetical protein SEA_DIRTYBOI_63 [Gordonia phage DirtyBoi]|nr:hypothetical protein SEA_DIRTYBOI_63 [Gordonia phage DirtyBoi]